MFWGSRCGDKFSFWQRFVWENLQHVLIVGMQSFFGLDDKVRGVSRKIGSLGTGRKGGQTGRSITVLLHTHIIFAIIIIIIIVMAGTAAMAQWLHTNGAAGGIYSFFP